MALKLFKPKNQTAIRGQSSALVVTIVLHAILGVAAGYMVAVTIKQKEEAEFKAQTIDRPKLDLKKLQVPVKIEEQAKKQPKLRPQSAPRVTTRKTDFVMPAITGKGGGTGVDLSGASLKGSLGFGNTQINLFRIKSKGDTFLFVLDTSRNTLNDDLGGIPAYTIIKNELVGLIGRLPPTVLFNVAVFDREGCQAFSKDLCTATEENVKKLKKWLGPLNTDKKRFGRGTLGGTGAFLSFEPLPIIPNKQSGWIQALTFAVKKNVDVMYWLGTDDEVDWISQDFLNDARNGKPLSEPSGRYPHLVYPEGYSGGAKKWNEVVARAQELLDQENKARRARGEPDRIIGSSGNSVALVKEMLPGSPVPPQEDIYRGHLRYHYTANDILQYIEDLQAKYKDQDLRTALAKLKRKKFRVNVVNFVPKTIGQSASRVEFDVVKDLSSKTGGSYVKIQGLDAIRSAATEDSEVIIE